MPWDRVHEEAEVLEHHISEELEELIAAKLGEPALDPHGDPIPDRDLAVIADDSVPLTELEQGEEANLHPRLRQRRRDAAIPGGARASSPGARLTGQGPASPSGALMVEIAWPHASTRAGARGEHAESRRTRTQGMSEHGAQPSSRGGCRLRRPARRASFPRHRLRGASSAGQNTSCPRTSSPARLRSPGGATLAGRRVARASSASGPSWARLHRRGRLHRPRQLRDQHRRWRQVRLPAALGRARAPT